MLTCRHNSVACSVECERTPFDIGVGFVAGRGRQLRIALRYRVLFRVLTSSIASADETAFLSAELRTILKTASFLQNYFFKTLEAEQKGPVPSASPIPQVRCRRCPSLASISRSPAHDALSHQLCLINFHESGQFCC